MILPILLNRTKLLPIYVVGIGGHKSQDPITRPCGFQSYQLLYCTGGSGILRIEEQEYVIAQGDAFFFRPDIPHEYFAQNEPWSVRWVVFHGSAVEDIITYLGFGNSEVFHIHDLNSFDVQVSAMSDMYWCEDPNKEIKTSMLMYKLLIKMGECRNDTAKPSGMSKNEKYQKLRPVIETLKMRYKEDLSLRDLAEVIGVTNNHLCRLFQQVYDTTPIKYLTHLRLNMAKYYLCSADCPKVREVAAAVGFKDPSYFCAVFKKAEGMTPEEFRRINAF